MEMDMQWAFTVLPKPTGHKRPCILFPNSTGNRSGLHIQTMAHHTIVNHLLFFTPRNVSTHQILECCQRPDGEWAEHNITQVISMGVR